VRFTRKIQRIPPRLPVEAVKTYEVRAPVKTHWTTVPCGHPDLDPPCEHHAVGWLTVLDPTVHGAQLNYIRLHSGRSYQDARTLPFDILEMLTIPDGMVALWFPAGQQCFREHKVPLEREPILVVRGGDWRGNPRGEQRVHVRRDDWVEDFAEHQQTLADRYNQG
jgi:hypothetical protein